MKLTEGAIAMLATGETQTGGIKPLLQVAEIRTFVTNTTTSTITGGNNDRYRLLVSDGVYLEQCLLSTQLNQLVHSGSVQKGSVVRLTDFVCSFVQNRRITIILDLDVMLKKCDPIGEPRPLKMDGAALSLPINQAIPSFHSGPGNQAGSSFISQNEASTRIIPIAALNPYQTKWTIKARVTAKAELRHFNKHGSDGKVFSFELLDIDGGEIKVTCFNTVADQFYHQVEQGKVYTISNGSVRPAQKNYNHLPNDYEIILANTSLIQPCFEDDNLVPKPKFKFRPIHEIQCIEKDSVVDVIGGMFSISPPVPILRKNGTETQKRTLQLKDMSGMSIEVTLWGNLCNVEGHTLQNMYDSGGFAILAIKSCKVDDFKGKSLGTLPSSQLFIEPDFPEAHELKAWFETNGKSTRSISMNVDIIQSDVRKTISQIGVSEKPDWIMVCATLTYIKADNVVYTACPLMVGDRKCHKKVTRIGDGKWRCDRCCRVLDECEYRYAFQFQIQDHTGLAWVTAFQESGEDILGVPARDLYRLKYEEEDNDKFAEILHCPKFIRYLFKLRVKEVAFGDEHRVKFTASKVVNVNFASDTKYLFNLICKPKEQDFSLLLSKAQSGNITPSKYGNISRQVGRS